MIKNNGLEIQSKPVPDPDLEKKGGLSSPPDPEIRGEAQSPKNFFWPFGPQLSLKIRGRVRGGGPLPMDLPLKAFLS